MNRSDYRKIAKEHGISVKEVKRDMQEAINSAYVNPNAEALSVPRKGKTPTPDEFIDYMVDKVKKGK